MQIRRYEDTDLEEVVALWLEVKRVAYPYLPLEQKYTYEENLAFFRDRIAKECEIWLAVADETIAGFLALKGCYMDRLYVAVGRQRTGIGERLLAKARQRSPQTLSLHTHQKNTQARAFYEKHGFWIVKLGISPPPESEPDIEYRWP